MLKTICQSIGFVFLLSFSSCARGDYQDIKTAIQVTGASSNPSHIKTILSDRFSRGGFEDVKIVEGANKNEFIVTAAIQEGKKVSFNALLGSARLGMWHTYRVSNKAIQDIDPERLNVPNFQSYLIAEKGFVSEDAIGICQDSNSLDLVVQNLEANLADVKNLKLIWGTIQNRHNKSGEYQYQLYMVNTDGDSSAPITDSDVSTAGTYNDPQSGRILVSLAFDERGGVKWSDMTREAAFDGQRTIAIVLNDQVIMCPKVMQQITGGSSVIGADFTEQEAERLAIQLKMGRLPFDVRVLSQEVLEEATQH